MADALAHIKVKEFVRCGKGGGGQHRDDVKVKPCCLQLPDPGEDLRVGAAPTSRATVGVVKARGPSTLTPTRMPCAAMRSIQASLKEGPIRLQAVGDLQGWRRGLRNDGECLAVIACRKHQRFTGMPDDRQVLADVGGSRRSPARHALRWRASCVA